jgi:hypothetical protein
VRAGSDARLTAGVAGLLLGELLEHLASTGHPVTALAHGDVQNQFIDLNFAHDIVLVRLQAASMVSKHTHIHICNTVLSNTRP